jgi:hypothetical protein
MARRSGIRVGVRTGFGWISMPAEELGIGTQFLLLLSEVFSLTNRVFKPRSRRRRDPIVTLIGLVVGLVLYPVVFLALFLLVCGPWFVTVTTRAIAGRRARVS